MNQHQKGQVAVLLSGRGSNFKAIHDHSLKPGSNYTVRLVISNKSGAAGLRLAEQFGVRHRVIRRKEFESLEDYEEEMIREIRESGIDLICLAGFMKILSPLFIDEFRNRIMNIHPSLLPAFPGLDAQMQALEYGVKVSGCSVHFVDSGVDTGPIILQRTVPVEEEDDPESLSERILEQEHLIYPQAVTLWFDGKLKIEGRHVIICP